MWDKIVKECINCNFQKHLQTYSTYCNFFGYFSVKHAQKLDDQGQEIINNVNEFRSRRVMK
jgi:hypothetical protein